MAATPPRTCAQHFQDERSIAALKVLKAVREGSLDPSSRRFDCAWSLDAAAQVDDPMEARDLVAWAFPDDVYGPVPDSMAESFLAVLGEEVQCTSSWVQRMSIWNLMALPHAIFSGLVALARMSAVSPVRDPVALRLPGPVLRLVRSFLYPREPLGPLGRALHSWPLPWVRWRRNEAKGLFLLQAPDCDLELFGRDLLDSLAFNTVRPQRLEGGTWSEFLGHLIPHDRNDDWPRSELTAGVALSALRVQSRLAARLPVVLLGCPGEGAGDVQVCALANWLLQIADGVPTAAAHELRWHEGAGAPLAALFEQLRPGEGPIVLVRVRADAVEERSAQVRRFAELAAPCWGAVPPQNPRVVLSVALRPGASPRGLLGSLPPLFGEAVQFLH